MRVIIQKLGKQDQADLSFITNSDGKIFIKGIQASQPSKDGKKFIDELDHISQPLKDIVSKMLEFNPYLRSSTRELIKDPYFDDIRIPQMEKHAP